MKTYIVTFSESFPSPSPRFRHTRTETWETPDVEAAYELYNQLRHGWDPQTRTGYVRDLRVREVLESEGW